MMSTAGVVFIEGGLREGIRKSKTVTTSPSQGLSYVLKVRQQPKHSRMCGHGGKDRRPIDPPPIVQLHAFDYQGRPDKAFLLNPYYFMQASLCSPETGEEFYVMNDGKSSLMSGTVTSSLFCLKDTNEHMGGFFVFSDLSVKIEGTFRLKFKFYEILGGDIVCLRSMIVSDIFHVYSAKKFPGMEESTLLSRSFAEQGLKIRIRKEIRPRRPTYTRLVTATEPNGINYQEDSSNQEVKTPDSFESTSSSGFNRHVSEITRDTSNHSPTDLLETETPIETRLPNPINRLENQLTEQEESAQSGLMLLASLPFLQPETTTTMPRFLPSLSLSTTSLSRQHHPSYSYQQHPMTTATTTTSSFDERFGQQQHTMCSLHPNPITTSMHGFYEYHTNGFFPNSNTISSNFLTQKNLIA